MRDGLDKRQPENEKYRFRLPLLFLFAGNCSPPAPDKGSLKPLQNL
ncbi:hypothetical protein [Kingella sp. (in: b-proteobacteria)]|nr:hypothetical protein [Kingella sp. (in: b-proteobacteria)]MDO4656857.1 hypothetical protein [Kingella sp. (in: b-proteobacteria)]